MGFDLNSLIQAVAQHGRVARVVVAATHGSTPREVGAAMLVWETGQSGTIGGGTLEFNLARAARSQVAPNQLGRHALGPEMGQCCGGAVDVLTEIYDAERVKTLTQQPLFARSVTGHGDMPFKVKRLLAATRAQGVPPIPQLIGDWMIEPFETPATTLWIWGAGHVGRAMVHTLAPLPWVQITWVDTATDRFPDEIPPNVTALPAQGPARLVRHAPVDAHHLVLTYSHALDLELCHQLLAHGFGRVGLIGSDTKWARFRKRLALLGHTGEQIARIQCPIGDPGLGKHPQAIAVGVAAALLNERSPQQLGQEKTA